VPLWFRPIKEGTYEVICAQLCGAGHFGMRAEMTVESQQSWDGWYKSIAEMQHPKAAESAPATAPAAPAPPTAAPAPGNPAAPGATPTPTPAPATPAAATPAQPVATPTPGAAR
jgi:cytochrome c oxidase subunit 2